MLPFSRPISQAKKRIYNNKSMFSLHSRANGPRIPRRQLEKQKRQSGFSYMSKEGIPRLGRSMKEPCNNCRFDCHRFSESERKVIFDQYYGLGDRCLQWQFITNSIVDHVPNRRPNKPKTKRFHTYVYSFALGEIKLRVCKEFFTNTLGISNRIIDTALRKSDTNGELLVSDLCWLPKRKHFAITSEWVNDREY